jgi:hypothetical protein
MDELTRLLHATQALIEATHNVNVSAQAFKDAMVEFSKRVSLESIDDDVPGLDDPGDALDPPMSDDEMRNFLDRARDTLGIGAVRQALQDEVGGKKVAQMSQQERNCVRISLEKALVATYS